MTILTPNRRLSAHLLKQHNQAQATNIAPAHDTHVLSNINCWPTIDVLPIQSWLLRIWNEYSSQQITQTLPQLLTAQQEAILWEEILNQSSLKNSLLQISATADMAKSAWGLLKQWNLELDHSGLNTTEDSKTFLTWARQFKKLCQQNNWLDTQSLPELITNLIQTNKIKPPKEIILYGFTELTPQQNRLFSICEQNGSVISHQNNLAENNLSRLRTCSTDEESEIYTMARFAKYQLQHCTDQKLTIGCVVPQLENRRDRISQIFSEVFLDKSLFNISAGKKLTSYSIIQMALELLKLLSGTITIDRLSILLRSPFMGDAEREYIKRSQLDLKLRSENRSSVTLDILIKSKCVLLAKRIESLPTTNENQSLSMNAWAVFFMDCLKILGWPGERSLNSNEYQIVQRWLDVFTEFQELDLILSPRNYHEALHILEQMTTKTIFQPQTPEAPVQVLGMLEAAEIPFDYLWVMGLDDTSWPPFAKPNPFIPHPLQKMLNMPHAAAERELEYSKRLMEQLTNSAKNIIFSYAQKNNDFEQQPSSLILPVESISSTELKLAEFQSFANTLFQSKSLDTIIDEQASMISADEKISGGVSIIKQQAACPFKAFAEFRLHAKPVEEITPGLREQDRGTIIHKALELIWKQCLDSASLAALSENELKKIIDDAARQALETIVNRGTPKGSRYLQLELDRLNNMLWNWLEIEKSRPAFKVISQEEKRQFQIGHLPISLRIDRIDELEHDGSQLIIDYKTGKDNSTQKWFGDRPDEPQLPLYCISDPERATAIAFAQVRVDKPCFKGISKDETEIKSIQKIKSKTWKQQVDEWQTTLTDISNEFYQGIARVSPKNKDETCRLCQLQILCRIYE